MSTCVAVLLCSLLGLGPVMVEAGTTSEQRPERRQLIRRVI
jgi:hypothetical protein